jgi:APA family basic amino acid/polyamine antiporter
VTAPTRFIDPRTAALLVVASMIGTGVFTTLGFQADAVPDGAALLLVWILGALVALCGALSYAELVAALPRSGGEYHLLSRIYHPVLGELAGFVSVTVGFAAPVALTAVALARYLGTVVAVEPLWTAIGVVVLVTALHGIDMELGRRFQVVATLAKVGFILVFCGIALAQGPVPGGLPVLPTADTPGAVLSTPFGLALIYVSYAYAGWNAAAYVVDEVQDPARTVPRALVQGTLLVAALYLLLNLAFLRTVPLDELRGTIEVGAVSARYVFGETGGDLLSLALSLLLVSSVSALVLTGPRVLQTMGRDIRALRWLGGLSRRGAPTRALLLQQGLAIAMILTDSFEGVLTFAGFTLSLFACITVAGVFLLRSREPALERPYRIPLYPWPPLVFVVMSLIGLLAVLIERPLTVLTVAGLLVGVALVLARRSQSLDGESRRV